MNSSIAASMIAARRSAARAARLEGVVGNGAFGFVAVAEMAFSPWRRPADFGWAAGPDLAREFDMLII
jgi:hypothetical protein